MTNIADSTLPDDNSAIEENHDIDICDVFVAPELVDYLIAQQWMTDNGVLRIPCTTAYDSNTDRSSLSYNTTGMRPLGQEYNLTARLDDAATKWGPDGAVQFELHHTANTTDADAAPLLSFAECPSGEGSYVMPNNGDTSQGGQFSGGFICLSSADTGEFLRAIGELLGITPIIPDTVGASILAQDFADANMTLTQGTVMVPPDKNDTGNAATKPTCFDLQLLQDALSCNSNVPTPAPFAILPPGSSAPTFSPTKTKLDFTGIWLTHDEMKSISFAQWPVNENGTVVINYIDGLMPGFNASDYYSYRNISDIRPYSDDYNLTADLEEVMYGWGRGSIHLQKVDASDYEEKDVFQVGICRYEPGSKFIAFGSPFYDEDGIITGARVCVTGKERGILSHEAGHALGFQHPVELQSVRCAVQKAGLTLQDVTVMSAPAGRLPTRFDEELSAYNVLGEKLDLDPMLALTQSPTLAPTQSPTLTPAHSPARDGFSASENIGLIVGVAATGLLAVAGLVTTARKGWCSCTQDEATVVESEGVAGDPQGWREVEDSRRIQGDTNVISRV